MWSVVAIAEGRGLGHAVTVPASLHPRRDPDPALLHLAGLFVRPPTWGTGAASALLVAAVADGAGRGFGRMRLFTPAGHARARRFYQREGWAATTAPSFDPDFGLELLEYRRPLP